MPNKLIIFDFMRTLFDPETSSLTPDALEVVATLQQRGYILVLISHDEGNRDSLIEELGLTPYFTKIIIVKEKTEAVFAAVVEKHTADITNSFVIGDRIRKEILFGNRCGLKTIWLKCGKFFNEIPLTKDEKPTHTIRTLKEALAIIP